ncbi:hypothetical protein [Vibrio metschnikovii]|uniref:hypothetical protein n=1 Tax=Vibrio metschnikovii TaxID=28172 RepID=UPI002FC7CA63
MKEQNISIPIPTDIGDDETLRNYALRKEAECNELRERVATLRETISEACMMNDAERVSEKLANALSI